MHASKFCVIQLLPNWNWKISTRNDGIALGFSVQCDECHNSQIQITHITLSFIAREIMMQIDHRNWERGREIDKLNILILRKHNSLIQHNHTSYELIDFILNLCLSLAQHIIHWLCCRCIFHNIFFFRYFRLPSNFPHSHSHGLFSPFEIFNRMQCSNGLWLSVT